MKQENNSALSLKNFNNLSEQDNRLTSSTLTENYDN